MPTILGRGRETLGWAVARPIRRAALRGALVGLILGLLLTVPATAALVWLNLGATLVPFVVGVALGLNVFVPTLLESKAAPPVEQGRLILVGASAVSVFLGSLCLIGSPFYAIEMWGSGSVELAVENALKLGPGPGPMRFERLTLLATVSIPWSLVVGVATLGEVRDFDRRSLATAVCVFSGTPLIALGTALSLGAATIWVVLLPLLALFGPVALVFVVGLRQVYAWADRLEARVWAVAEQTEVTELE